MNTSHTIPLISSNPILLTTVNNTNKSSLNPQNNYQNIYQNKRKSKKKYIISTYTVEVVLA